MILNTRFSKYLLSVVMFFIFSMAFFVNSSSDQLSWFGRVFSDSFYIFQLAAIFIFGIVLIDQHYSVSIIIRIGSREKATFEQLIFKYTFAFIYLNVWFMLIVLLTTLMFEAPYIYDISAILNRYIHYLLGLLILTNLAEIFKRSSFRALRFSPITLSYLIMLVEVCVIVPLIISLNIRHISFVYGWVFNENVISYIALFITFVVSLYYLIRFSSKKDIL